MDRRLVYDGAIPVADDILVPEKATMLALGYALRAFLGPCTVAVVDGLAIAPSTVPDLHVSIGVGSIHSSQVVDQNAYGDLGTDTGHTVVKQGILHNPVTLTIAPPGTAGFSQVFLVQVAFSEVDGGSLTLPYFNPDDPDSPYAGPDNSGTSQNTLRFGNVTVQLKAGTGATTGTQTTPAPDAGFVGLYAITVANGTTAITTGNIATLATSPFIPTKLPTLPADVQSGKWSYADDTGTANNLVVTLNPAPAAYVKGLHISVKLAHDITGATVIDANGLGNKSIVHPSGAGLSKGDGPTGAFLELVYDGTAFQVVSGQPSLLIDSAVSFTVHGTSPDFTDLYAAFAYLSKFTVTQSGSVTLNIAAGKFTAPYTIPLVIDHPNSDRIILNGAAPTSTPPNSVSGATSTFVTRAKASP